MLTTWGANSLEALVAVGYGATTTGSNYSINASSIHFGFIFRAPSNDTMTGFGMPHAGNTGTVASGAQADLYALGSDGLPTGASLATAIYTPTFGTNIITWSSSYNVTADTCYAVVIKNILAEPASNYFVVNNTVTTDTFLDRLWLCSANSGATWQANSSLSQYANGYPIYTTNGSYGLPFYGGSVWTGSPGIDAIYNTSGSRISVHAQKVNFNCTVKVRGIKFILGKTGSPTFNLKGVICSSSSILSSSDSVWNAANTSVNGAVQWVTPYELAANTDYYVGISPVDATAGDASNYAKTYQCSTGIAGNSLARTTPPWFGAYKSSGSSISFSTMATNEGGGFHLLLEIVGGLNGSTSMFRNGIKSGGQL